MKTRLLTACVAAFAFLIIVPATTWAQTSMSFRVGEPHMLGKHDVIKAYNYPTTISSSVLSMSNYTHFMLNNEHHGEILTLLDGCAVSDFVIENDTVFFCGKDNEDKGVIGFFSIQGHFVNGGQFFYNNYFPILNYYHAEAFNRLVSYRDTTGRRHIVCVGKAKSNSRAGLYPCIVDLFTESNGEYLAYNAGVISDTNIENSMMDIKRFCTAAYPVRDDMSGGYFPCDYLVVAGIDANQQLCLRFFNTQDPFSTSGPQDALYTFDNYGDYLWTHRHSDPLIYPMSDSSIAVASVYYTQLFNLSTYKALHFCEINIHKLLNGLSTSMIRSVGVRLDGSLRVSELNQFLYNTHTSRFAALFDAQSPNDDNQNSFFIETDYSLTSALNLLTGADGDTICGNRFTGMDFYNSMSQYVLYGHCYSQGNRDNFEIPQVLLHCACRRQRQHLPRSFQSNRAVMIRRWRLSGGAMVSK